MVHGLSVTTVKGDIPYIVMRIKLKVMARSNWSSSMVVVLVGILAVAMAVAMGGAMGVMMGGAMGVTMGGAMGVSMGVSIGVSAGNN